MIATLKSVAFALIATMLVSLVFLMPVTLQLDLVGRIPPVAHAFCPESGQLAPRYFSSSSGPSDPSEWVACLDAKGERIQDWGRHQTITFSIAGLWMVLLFPVALLAVRSVVASGRDRPKYRTRRSRR